ncbi:MAG: GerMN domain-containing protein [Candidatus Sericytochromatia bacterium]
MKLGKIYKLLVTTSLLFSISCTKETEQLVTLYYSDNQAMYFIPVTTNVKLKGDIKSIQKPRDLIPILMKLEEPIDKELRVCIPKETTFSDIALDQDKKEISLKIETKKDRLSDKEEELMIGSIVNTLTDLKGYNSVKINSGNLKTEMDYSESISRDSYRNQWLLSDEIDDKKSVGVVYWLTKNKKYIVPVSVPIIKNDVTNLLSTLKKGPQGSRKTFFENSIDSSLDIIIKAVNLNHIDIELKNKSSIKPEIFDKAKQAIALSISELNVFDTIKFITPNMTEEIIDIRKDNPRENINKIILSETNS